MLFRKYNSFKNPINAIPVENIITLDFIWMDLLRGIAVVAIVIHHWIFFIPHKSTLLTIYNIAEVIQSLTGTFVHIFFILSGCGLILSYLTRGIVSWKRWAKRRFRKIILPYWIIVTLTFLLANFSFYISPALVNNHYTWHSLFAYLTLTRNFYSKTWGMNPTLWFMPVIIGLYILFPLLVNIMKIFGIFVLLIISILITYGSIVVCIICGYPITHQAAIPLFYISEFALGMFFGYFSYFFPHQFNRLINFKSFFLGICLYSLSWIITKIWVFGSYFNDFCTAIGIYLITLYACRWIIRFSPEKAIRLLKRLSKESYVMYLMHGAFILFIIKPILINTMNSPINSCMTIFCSFIYCSVIFLLARLISPLINLIAPSTQNSLK